MGYRSHPIETPGGEYRDDTDHARLRHARDRQQGFLVGRFLQPPPMLFTRDGHNVFLGDTLRGGHAFLVCGGPSLSRHDLLKLQNRGITTCAVNNAATVVRPNYWVSVDDPGNFCDAIWRDPAITKLVPLCHMEKPFTVRGEKGELLPSEELVGDMPNVFGFRRNESFVAEQWLYEDTINWGNHGERVDAYGFRGSRSVMLAAVRLMFYLGVRTIYLLGCDFKMASDAPSNYAFPQERSRASVKGNNQTFAALNVRFQHLLPYFENEGFRIFNCTPDSGLKAFPFLDYEQAIEQTLATFPRQIITTGMYDRKNRPVDKPKTKSSDAIRPQLFATSESHAPREQETSLPLTTLVTAVDSRNAHLLPWTWRTWIQFHPSIARLPAFVLFNEKEPLNGLTEDLRSIHPTVEFVPWRPDANLSGRDAWSHAMVKFPAEAVQTPWYLKLEPEAIAIQNVPWIMDDWFQPDPQGRNTAYVAAPWGYSKPANILQQLEAWANASPRMSECPPVQASFNAASDRVYHEAISTWLFLGNTAWTREIFATVPDSLPCPSFDTFMAYCAARQRDRIIRWPLKKHGWDHSYSGHDKLIARCQKLLAPKGTTSS